MTLTLTTAFVLLAALQIAHQASIDNDDLNTFNSRLNKIVSYNSELIDLSKSHFQKSVYNNQNVNSELARNDNTISSDHDNYNIFSRSKRQIEQDDNSNAEFISNDSDAVSSEKSLQITTTNGLIHDNSPEKKDGDLSDEDSNINDKNHLMETKNDQEEQEEREDQASNEEKGADDSKSAEKASSFNIEPTLMSDEADKKEDSINETDDVQADGDTVGIDTDLNVEEDINVANTYEENQNDEMSTDNKANPSMEEKDNKMFDGNEKQSKAENPKSLEDNENEEGSLIADEHSKEATSNGDTNLSDNNLSIEEQPFSKMGAAEDNEETESNPFDEDDVATFIPLKSEVGHSQLAHLKQSDDDEDEEGSGGMDLEIPGSHETEISIKNGSDENTFLNATSKTDLGNLDIDDDSNKSSVEQANYEVDEEENETSEEEEEGPIPDPTDNSSRNNDSSNNGDLSNETTSVPIDTFSTSDVDPSNTYDPSKVVDPLGIDNPTHIMEKIGLDTLFNIGNSPIEGSGSGSDNDDSTNGLLTDHLFKYTTEREDTTSKENVANESTIISSKIHPVNSAQINVGPKKNFSVVAPILADIVVEPTGSKPINEIGVNNGKESSTNTDEGSASGSTGSFIVLGAIMATIVVLLGYSVIKSHRQKRLASRKPPPSDNETELNTFLPGKNGHSPGIKVNVEGEKLLTPRIDDERNGLTRDDDHPVYRNGTHPENGIAGVHTPNALNPENNSDLSEIKVEKPQNPPQETKSSNFSPDGVASVKPANISSNSSVPFTNGHSATDPRSNNIPDNKPDGMESPKADDRGSWVYGTQPEAARIKMFIDHDSIPKTPVLINKRGSSDTNM